MATMATVRILWKPDAAPAALANRRIHPRRIHRRSVPGGLTLVVGLLIVVGAACSSGSTAEPGTGAEVSADTAAGSAADGVERGRPESKPTINLGVTDWTGARLNAAIAERIIELRLGYPVETVEVVDLGRMMGDLGSGELDAVLEVWPSTLAPEEVELIDRGEVEPLGPLGVVGKVGWWVPRFVLEDDPSLATWEGFDSDGVAARFAGPDTGGRGRFLGTDPNYEQADEQLIEALDLPFEVFYSGSDEATAQEVARSIAAMEPVVLFWWTPTAEVTRFDLVEVELPPRTEACEATIEAGGPQACDYAEDPLLKLGSPLLGEKAPDLRGFLAAFRLSTEEQLDLIDQVDNRGRSIDVVALGWVENNADRWSKWLE